MGLVGEGNSFRIIYQVLFKFKEWFKLESSEVKFSIQYCIVTILLFISGEC